MLRTLATCSRGAMLQSGSFSETIQYPSRPHDFENSIPPETPSLNVCHLGSLAGGFLTPSLSYFAFTRQLDCRRVPIFTTMAPDESPGSPLTDIDSDEFT